MAHALRAPTSRAWLVLAALSGLLSTTTSVRAQLPLEPSGLRGGRHVGSAAAPSSVPRAVAGFGYAYTEGVLDGSDRHQRGMLELAGAYAPLALLQLSLGVAARYDAHQSEREGDDRGGAFETIVRTRHAYVPTPSLALAAQTALRFPAAESARRGLRATTPELGALATYALAARYALSGTLGYRFDRSERSVADPALLSRADRLSASLSRFDALLLGALLELPLGRLTGTLEWSWDVAVGAGAPRAAASPMRLRAAVQTTLAERYVPGLELGVSPSARPELTSGARIEPRLWLAATLGVLFGRTRQRTDAAPVPASSSPREPAPAPLVVRVLDPAGAPLAGAEVALAGKPPVTTDEAGRVTLTLPEGGATSLAVTHAGFEPSRTELSATPQGELSVTLARVLPEGEIKGKVRSLRGGRPVQARVKVEPLGVEVDTSASGEFVIHVPSGHYTLEISAPGHEPQRRPAQVEHLGVTILVVDLRRARR